MSWFSLFEPSLACTLNRVSTVSNSTHMSHQVYAVSSQQSTHTQARSRLVRTPRLVLHTHASQKRHRMGSAALHTWAALLSSASLLAHLSQPPCPCRLCGRCWSARIRHASSPDRRQASPGVLPAAAGLSHTVTLSTSHLSSPLLWDVPRALRLGVVHPARSRAHFSHARRRDDWTRHAGRGPWLTPPSLATAPRVVAISHLLCVV